MATLIEIQAGCQSWLDSLPLSLSAASEWP
jgi:hypothetical protein